MEGEKTDEDHKEEEGSTCIWKAGNIWLCEDV